MIKFKFLLMLFFCLVFSNSYDSDYFIEKTNNQFNLINDYKVDMIIESLIKYHIEK